MKKVKIIFVLLSVVAVLGAAGILTTAYASSSVMAPSPFETFIGNLLGIDTSQAVSLGSLIPIALIALVLIIVVLIVSAVRVGRAKKSGGSYSAQAMEAIPDAVIGINKNANIVFVNQATLKMFEAKEAEFLGKKVFTILNFKNDSTSQKVNDPLTDALLIEYPATVKKLMNVKKCKHQLVYEVAKGKEIYKCKESTVGFH